MMGGSQAGILASMSGDRATGRSRASVRLGRERSTKSIQSKSRSETFPTTNPISRNSNEV